jgi:hypothetical protein
LRHLSIGAGKRARALKTACLFACLLAVPLAAQQPPKTMTKMVVQLQSTDVPAASFATRPKTMLRAGTKYCRTEEEPDPAHGIHGLTIIDEPDVWMVNLADKSAKHMVDPGPTFYCRMPILASRFSELPEAEAKQVAGLEFGNELAYFQSKGATLAPGPVLQTKQTVKFQLQFGESSVALFAYGTPEKPLAVVWTRGDKHDIYWYSGYGEVDFDATLFAKPGGVKIEDAKP